MQGNMTSMEDEIAQLKKCSILALPFQEESVYNTINQALKEIDDHEDSGGQCGFLFPEISAD